MEIWLDDEAVNDHFIRVKEQMKNPSSGGDWEDVDTEQNVLTRDLRKEVRHG